MDRRPNDRDKRISTTQGETQMFGERRLDGKAWNSKSRGMQKLKLNVQRADLERMLEVRRLICLHSNTTIHQQENSWYQQTRGRRIELWDARHLCTTMRTDQALILSQAMITHIIVLMIRIVKEANLISHK